MKKGEYATNAQLWSGRPLHPGRPWIATAAEAREILGIKPEKGVLYQPNYSESEKCAMKYDFETILTAIRPSAAPEYRIMKHPRAISPQGIVPLSVADMEFRNALRY